jgi:hypothetical protein
MLTLFLLKVCLVAVEGVESQTAPAVEWEAEDASSKASYVEWEARENANRPTTGDRTTVAGVVADKLFQKAKFIDRDFDLGTMKQRDQFVNL